ncbi:hypothetical protein [Sphingomonas paucimobilis]|uniref:hypothetical protein n=1 Tax=Sphingomonas paucimobilis TaxID=13689 RepID=UPI0028D38A62|nr:hypothetical protein [Sphingomonas paucimobilis]
MKLPSASSSVGVSPPGIHLELLPLPLLAHRRHVVDLLLDAVGDGRLVPEDARALGIATLTGWSLPAPGKAPA